MEIKHEHDGHKGAFYWDDDGSRMGESTYTMAGPERLIIDHTLVEDSLRGTGKGAELVLAVVDYARENGLKILPLCPFASTMFSKYRKEWADVRV